MHRLRLLALPLVALLSLLVGGGCFTSQTLQYGFNDSTIEPSSDAYFLVNEEEEPTVLAVETQIASPFLGNDAPRWIVLPLGNDLEPPVQLAVPEAAGLEAGELRAWVQLADSATIRRLSDAAHDARDRFVATPAEPALARQSDTVANVFFTKLTDDTLLFAYAPMSLAEAEARQRLRFAPVTTRPALPPIEYQHVMVLPYSYETTPGDKFIRGLLGVTFTPLALVGDAAVGVGGATAAVFAGPPFLVSYVLSPLFR